MANCANCDECRDLAAGEHVDTCTKPEHHRCERCGHCRYMHAPVHIDGGVRGYRKQQTP